MENQDTRGQKSNTFKFLLILLILALIGVTVAYSPFFRVSKINIRGNSYVSSEEVCRVAEISTGVNMFSIQTDVIARRMMKDVRFEQVNIRRTFPGQIDIELVERRPIICVPGQYGYVALDRNGMVIDAHKNLTQMQIPLLTGEVLPDNIYIGDTVTSDNIKGVLTFVSALDADSVARLSDINVSNPEKVVIYTTDAVQLRLGELKDLEKKAEITRSFMEELKVAKHPIEYIDINYSSPFIKFKQ